MLSSATNVLLNGGKAKVSAQRAASSHKPKKRTKESNCQKRGFAIWPFCSTESVFSGPDKEAQSAALRAVPSRQRAGGRSDGVLRFKPITPPLQLPFHFTLASAASSGAKCQKSSTLRFSPVSAPERL